jgi:hypothetical protein
MYRRFLNNGNIKSFIGYGYKNLRYNSQVASRALRCIHSGLNVALTVFTSPARRAGAGARLYFGRAARGLGIGKALLSLLV